MLVSNTSTLVLLAKIGCLEQFIEVAEQIEIPEQVKREALFESDSYYSKLIEVLIQNNKLKVVPVKKIEIKRITSEFRLDEGEAAAYSLFTPEKYKAILTDDGELIKLCKLRRIPFICAMAVVIRLYEKNKLSREKAAEMLNRLKTHGRYSEEIYRHFKGEVEKNGNSICKT